MRNLINTLGETQFLIISLKELRRSLRAGNLGILSEVTLIHEDYHLAYGQMRCSHTDSR